MKKKILIVIGLTIIAVIGISSINTGRSISPLLKENIEALATDEWGGGHDDGGGGLVWYEYQTIEYTVKNENDPPALLCQTATCHGYGDLFCNGWQECIPAGL